MEANTPALIVKALEREIESDDRVIRLSKVSGDHNICIMAKRRKERISAIVHSLKKDIRKSRDCTSHEGK